MRITSKLCRGKVSKIVWIFVVLIILYLDFFDGSSNILVNEKAGTAKEGPLIHFNDYNGPNVSDIYTPGFSTHPSLVCKSDDEIPKLLIIFLSRPENLEIRKAIRYSWGDFGHYEDVQFAFLIGSAKSAHESKIVDEILKYKDIIRGKFMDNEENLPLKTISMLEWVSSNCPNAKFVLKVDDQTFVNVDKLLKIIEGKLKETKSIYGRISKFSNSVGSKNIEKSSPEFLAGPFYMMSGDSVKLLYNAALSAKLFKLEDVFITGIIANQVGIKRHNMEEVKDSISKLTNDCDLKNFVSISGVSADQHYELWFTINNEPDNCGQIEENE